MPMSRAELRPLDITAAIPGIEDYSPFYDTTNHVTNMDLTAMGSGVTARVQPDAHINLSSLGYVKASTKEKEEDPATKEAKEAAKMDQDQVAAKRVLEEEKVRIEEERNKTISYTALSYKNGIKMVKELLTHTEPHPNARYQ